MSRLRLLFSSYHPVVWSILLGTAFANIGSTLSIPFLAIYLSNQTDMNPVFIGLTVGAGAISGTFGGFIGGNLSDRYGRRIVMLSALYVWVIVFIGFAVSKIAALFLLLNVLNGLCRSFFEPTARALLSDLTKPEQRLKVFGMRYTAINVGASVGPLLGALLGMVNPTIPFLITAAVYLAYAVSLTLMLNRYRAETSTRASGNRVTFLGALGIIRRDVAFRYYLAGGIVTALGYSQMTVTLSQLVNNLFSLKGALLFSILMSVNAITVIVLQMPLTKLAEGREPMMVMTLGTIVYALGDIGFAFSSNWTLFILSMIVFSVGEVLVFPSGDVFLDRIAVNELRGTYFGARTFSNLGHFLGPLVGGFLLQEYGGTILYLVIAFISLWSILFYFGGQRVYNQRMQQAAEATHSSM